MTIEKLDMSCTLFCLDFRERLLTLELIDIDDAKSDLTIIQFQGNSIPCARLNLVLVLVTDPL